MVVHCLTARCVTCLPLLPKSGICREVIGMVADTLSWKTVNDSSTVTPTINIIEHTELHNFHINCLGKIKSCKRLIGKDFTIMESTKC